MAIFFALGPLVLSRSSLAYSSNPKATATALTPPADVSPAASASSCSHAGSHAAVSGSSRAAVSGSSRRAAVSGITCITCASRCIATLSCNWSSVSTCACNTRFIRKVG